ncbi:MAG: hypothetical protein O7F76_13130 [Planctomycetota bacterium]|nr:hypothetical protein [Planctomycetota bacterium]
MGYTDFFVTAIVPIDRRPNAGKQGPQMQPDAPPYQVMTTNHFVKSEDLNHHRTLYAGRCVEWCVQMAYVTAEGCFVHPRPLVFMSIRSLSMRQPARLGEILQLSGRVDYIGESTIGVRVDGRLLQPRNDRRLVVTGTFLFCTVDADSKAAPHGLPDLADQSSGALNRWKKCEAQAAAVVD